MIGKGLNRHNCRMLFKLRLSASRVQTYLHCEVSGSCCSLSSVPGEAGAPHGSFVPLKRANPVPSVSLSEHGLTICQSKFSTCNGLPVIAAEGYSTTDTVMSFRHAITLSRAVCQQDCNTITLNYPGLSPWQGRRSRSGRSGERRTNVHAKKSK